MYRHLMGILEKVFGGRGASMLWIVPLLFVIALSMLLIPAWRKREAAAWRGEAKLSLLTLLVAAVVRLIVLGTVVGVLAAALLIQQRLFSEKHGQVTERNLGAVRMKWGVPHEQGNLSVRHSIMRKVIEEELANGTRRQRLLEERQTPMGTGEDIIISEETFPALPEPSEGKNNPQRLVRKTTMWKLYHVDQSPIDAADVEIGIKSNPRTLGGASYAGYEDTWRLVYTVRNRAELATRAEFAFPLPAGGNGVFDQLTVKLDGTDWIPHIRYREGELQWEMLMKPDESHKVEVGYASRGLEYFRYKPASMLERCLVAVNVEGIPPSRLDYPIGSMPPLENRQSLRGDNYALHWSLSRAVTNLDIGIKLPDPEQPGYYITRLLGSAPVGLVLLAVALFATRWLIGRRFDVLHVCLVLLVFYIGHALLGNLNDVVRTFPAAFALSIVPVTAAVVWFWSRLDGWGFLALQSSVLVALFMVFYPLASLSDKAGGTLLHVMYAVLVVYGLALVAWSTVRSPQAEN